MGYLICSKCKSYSELQSGESPQDFVKECSCGGKLRYVENLDIVDPSWVPVSFPRKKTTSEILKDKMQAVHNIPRDAKNSLLHFYNNTIGKWVHNSRNRSRLYRTQRGTPYGMEAGFINSVINEFNFRNLRWILVIPVAIVMALISTYTPGIPTLLNFVLLIAVGYLFDNKIIGTKNAVVTGAISFFLGSILSGSFLLLIPLTILGGIDGAVCGWIGGYLKTRVAGRRVRW